MQSRAAAKLRDQYIGLIYAKVSERTGFSSGWKDCSKGNPEEQPCQPKENPVLIVPSSSRVVASEEGALPVGQTSLTASVKDQESVEPLPV